MEEKKLIGHTITITDKSSITINNVTKVISIKEELSQVETEAGPIQIYGKNLEIKKLDLDTGIININGEINAIKYDTKSQDNLLKKMFK